MNVTPQLEFELAYFEAAVQLFSHYASPRISVIEYLKPHYCVQIIVLDRIIDITGVQINSMEPKYSYKYLENNQISALNNP